MWKISLEGNTPTWQLISNGNLAQLGQYQTKGQTGSDFPAGRAFASSWFDANTNIFYLFGGTFQQVMDGITTAQADLNDLFSYNLATGSWTWLSGTSPNATTNNSTPLTEKEIVPASYTDSLSWIDSINHKLWLFSAIPLRSKNP
jgi:hypothetical protein